MSTSPRRWASSPGSVTGGCCEGGPTLLAQVVAAGRLDDLCLTLAPLLVAGDHRRIMRGPALDPSRPLSLAHLLEEEGALFARYLVPVR